MIAGEAPHDTVEKTDSNAADRRARLGIPVATLALAVSEDQRIASYARGRAHCLIGSFILRLLFFRLALLTAYLVRQSARPAY
ncbi:MAG: hypothetical protein WCD11_02730 [Solirubrobacteraceae bacterium]